MQDREKARTEKFTLSDAFEAALEWVFGNTKIGYLSVIGIILIILKLTGWLGSRGIPWIHVLWPFIFVVAVILIVTLVFRLKYDLKVIVENELEAKEYNEMIREGKTWVGSGVKGVILQMKWVKKK